MEILKKSGLNLKNNGAPNFNSNEFDCKCQKEDCKITKIDPKLALYLQVLRDLLMKPITITSGYRCPEHNKAVGGAENSQHVLGKAVDITVDGMSPKDVSAFADKLFNGIGIADNFLHLDIRQTKTRWTY